METATHTEIVTNAIVVTCVKSTHSNMRAPIHQVNQQVAHWNIGNITINGVSVNEWSIATEAFIELVEGLKKNPFNTKKEATQSVIDFFVELLDGYDTTNDPYARQDEIDFYNYLLNAFIKQ